MKTNELEKLEELLFRIKAADERFRAKSQALSEDLKSKIGVLTTAEQALGRAMSALEQQASKRFTRDLKK